MPQAIHLAAVDLGSNSFRLEIGACEHGQIHRVEYLKETVRQGGSLDTQRNLTPEAMERGWACLERFGDRLRGFDPRYVRAVATQTLREARNRHVFLERGSELLGYPIEVISGEDEAALIYRGVSSQLPASAEQRLVLDIGGRSTEFVLGSGSTIQAAISCRIGSVLWSMRHFPDGHVTPVAFREAQIAARAVLDGVLDVIPPQSWDVVYACAGTVNAVADILALHDQAPAGTITRTGLDWIRAQLLRAQHVDRLRLEGLKDDRRPVMAGGLSVLCAVFDLLGIEELRVGVGALRLGVLHELGRDAIVSDDLHHASVQALMRRFAVHPTHAQHVVQAVQHLWHQLFPGSAQAPAFLRWAALLHEVGCRIHRDNYHHHGAYILTHSQMAGFTSAEQAQIASLVLGHRGKLRKVQDWMQHDDNALQLLCLRLAVVLCNTRRAPSLAELQLTRQGTRLHLAAQPGWAARFPLSAQLLQEEAQAIARAGWTLTLSLP